MVAGQAKAMKIVIQAKAEVGQGPSREETTRCTVDKFMNGQRVNGVEPVPYIDEIIQVEGSLEGMTIQEQADQGK